MCRRGLLAFLMLMGMILSEVTYSATVEGVVKDSTTGNPLSGAIVRLRTGTTGGGIRDTTGEDGKFSFVEVEADTYALSITMNGYNQKTMNVIVEGETVTLEVLLSKPIITTVSGIVKDSTSGNPLNGAIVRLTRGNTTLRDTTDAEGKFSFSEVTADSYTVRITMNGYTEKNIRLTVGSEPVNIEILLVKPITTAVSGVVKDSSTGTPLNGAIVRLRRGNTTIGRDTTGEDGKFSF
ncbi:MAG: carboxypeptidase regulatory-like domain-containing protein, partial [Chitinispirillaceae bacterium]|nr:carboxypeptidase regulatory-like domain-containing protein [Chitinispirillaceae bacterium]